MKITVLLENTAARENLAAEHGLSLYIETAHRNILFDMGQTDAFARNAQALDVNLAHADLAVLSHGHYDHGGGMQTFLDIHPTAPVYLQRRAFGDYYHGPDKYIGLAKVLKQSARLRYVDDVCQIDEAISIHACPDAPLTQPIDSFGLSELKDGAHVPDAFAHEQYLRICEGGKTVLISGCAHRGIVNIARWFDADVVVGGFHLAKLDPANPDHRARLTAIADSLLATRAAYYTGHCTGAAAFAFLKEKMGPRLNAICGGTVIG